MQDDSLPSDEQARFDALPRAIEPPPHLEDRVVTALHATGALRPRRARSAWWRVAAAFVLLSGGFALGRVTAAQPGTASPSIGARYLLLLHGAHSTSPTEEAARVAEYAAWARDEGAAGRLLAGEKLGDSSEVLGANDPAALNVGPAGFFIIRASTLDDARAIAARCPHLRHGGTVVVRPIVEVGPR